MTPAPLAAQLDDLSAALGRPFGVPEGQQRYAPEGAPARRAYRVRVARSHERGRLAVLRGLPAGSKRADSQGAWLRAVQDSSELGVLRADTLASTMAVVRLLAWTADWRSMTTRPTLAVLVERSGLSRATVGRALRRLRAAGLLGVVAAGRSALYATARGGGAEAAVYVLAEPVPPAGEVEPARPVDEHEHPTASGLAGEPPHAGAREANSSSEPLRGRSWAAARPSAPESKPEGAAPRPADPAGSGRCGPDGRRLAAAQLRGRLAVLRRITTAHVAWAIADFVAAGWSVHELARAIDTRPDGTRWPHDGADGVDNVGAWLVYRLGAWRGSDGAPLASPGAVSLELARRRAAERRAAAAELDEQPAGDLPAGLALVHAVREQIIERGRRPWRSS